MREFGVRVTLGATALTLRRQVVREAALPVVAGLAVGGGVAASPAATLQPAVRAARVDPAVALRND